jgi:hypothetical protein
MIVDDGIGPVKVMSRRQTHNVLGRENHIEANRAKQGATIFVGIMAKLVLNPQLFGILFIYLLV